MIAMPRTINEILAHADELAARFESHVPNPRHIDDAAALQSLRTAVLARAEADRAVAAAVADAREAGHSWAAIGAMLGTSGEAARQRFGAPAGR